MAASPRDFLAFDLRCTDQACDRGGITNENKSVVFAISLGTVFEWHDFDLYATRGPRGVKQ
jgi:hypothetical protein